MGLRHFSEIKHAEEFGAIKKQEDKWIITAEKEENGDLKIDRWWKLFTLWQKQKSKVEYAKQKADEYYDQLL